jgi:hypothetical protein
LARFDPLLLIEAVAAITGIHQLKGKRMPKFGNGNASDGGGCASRYVSVPAVKHHSSTDLPCLTDIGIRGIGGEATKSKTKGVAPHPMLARHKNQQQITNSKNNKIEKTMRTNLKTKLKQITKQKCNTTSMSPKQTAGKREV